MPQVASSGEVYQVVVHGKIENQDCLNVFHFRASGADTDVYTNLLQALVSCFITVLIPALGGTYSLERVTGRRVTPDVGPEVEFIPDQNQQIAGGGTGDTLPSFASCVVSIHTTRGGRSGRGRMFLPPPPEGNTTASYINITGNYWPAVIAFVACVATKFISGGDPPVVPLWEIGVVSRKLGGVKPPFLAVGFAPATRLAPNRLLATQRSRKIGHGS